MSRDLEALRSQLSQPLRSPDAAAMTDLAGQTVAWVLHHLRTLPEQSIGLTASRAEMERLLREPPPEKGTNFAAVLVEFQEKVAPYAFRINHPRFLAFIASSPTFESMLGDWLCAGANFFAGVWLEAAGPAMVEVLVLDWFKEFLGYPAEARGVLTSGGSEANLTALVAARDRLPVAERSRAALYVTEQRHSSIDRAAKVIGLLPEQIQRVRADRLFRLDADVLTEMIARDRAAGRRPWAVVANAGATNTGAVDPLDTIVGICRKERLWLHVDAAYGWAALLTSDGKAALRGIAQADSVTLDPHKWFGQTFEAGCVLVRDGNHLHEAFMVRPDYMQDVAPRSDEINFCDYGVALTRRFRALKIWLSLKVLGVGWFRDLAERCCRLAELGQALLEQTGHFEILCPRHLSIVCFRYVPPGRDWQGAKRDQELNLFNLVLVEELRATGRAFLSSTRLGDCVALRFCFVNWRTTAVDVEEVVRLLQELAERLLSGDLSAERGVLAREKPV